MLVGRAALADRYLNEGRDALATEPAAAIAKAQRLAALNDEGLHAYYLEAAAWARLGDYRRARAALAEATRREPHDFVTWALLGDLATRRGDDAQALRDYRRALALNPRNLRWRKPRGGSSAAVRRIGAQRRAALTAVAAPCCWSLAPASGAPEQVDLGPARGRGA